jgi:hypothetical protein
MEKIDDLEAAFNAKIDAKFQEVLTRLPPQPQPGVHVPRARRIPLALPHAGTVTAMTAATEATTQDGYAVDEGEDMFEVENKLEEGEVQEPAPGCQQQYNRNASPPPRPVCDDEHVAN